MSRMDTVVAKLKSRETKLTENLDKIVEKSEVHEGHLVTVQVGIFESAIFSLFTRHCPDLIIAGSFGSGARTPKGA